MKPKVIIYQSNGILIDVIKETMLQVYNLKANQDFVATSDVDEITRLISDKEPQLLITGKIPIGDTGEFVQVLRDVNPHLITATFSSVFIPGPFEFRLPKLVDHVRVCEPILVTMNAFNLGTLKRARL